MERYIMIGPGPESKEEMDSGMEVWNETASEFPDVRTLNLFGSFSEPYIVGIFEAPSIDRIYALFHRFEEKWKESGMPMSDMEGESQMKLLPLDYYGEGEKLVYTQDLRTKAGIG